MLTVPCYRYQRMDLKPQNFGVIMYALWQQGFVPLLKQNSLLAVFGRYVCKWFCMLMDREVVY